LPENLGLTWADSGIFEPSREISHARRIQAFEKGRPISFALPLTGFAKAYDGPASDPAGLNELHETLPNELQRHPEDHLDTPNSK